MLQSSWLKTILHKEQFMHRKGSVIEKEKTKKEEESAFQHRVSL